MVLTQNELGAFPSSFQSFEQAFSLGLKREFCAQPFFGSACRRTQVCSEEALGLNKRTSFESLNTAMEPSSDVPRKLLRV